MEHTSATTLTDNTLHDERAHLDISSDGLVSHELAHQWFGDLLTCKDWGEVWLNESFATYFATLWTEHDRGWDEAAWERYEEARQYKSEDQRYRRPIVDYRYDTPDNMFDSHSYPKGGRVLHMLRFVLGDELFWKAIHAYVDANQYRVVETADLRKAVEDATGQGLNWFFDEWLYHGGHPEYEWDWSWDDVAHSVRVTVRQTQKTDEVTPLFRMPVEIEIATGSKSVIHRAEISRAEETLHFACDQRPTRVCFDPYDWILKTVKSTKGKDELRDQLANDPHATCRWQAAEELAGPGNDKDQDAVTALCRAARHDAFWGVRRTAIETLGKLTGDDIRRTLIEAAGGDDRSLVRRAAIDALAKFPHAETTAALQQIIQQDRSYYAVASALRALAKVDREHCQPALLEALATPSQNDTILNAACDALVELKSQDAAKRLAAMFAEPTTPHRRATVLAALVRLQPDDAALRDQLYRELDSDHLPVRRTALSAIATLDDPKALDVLADRRSREPRPRMVRAIDEAMEKLRDRQSKVERLEKEVESLRQQNRRLEERLKVIEEKTAAAVSK